VILSKGFSRPPLSKNLPVEFKEEVKRPKMDLGFLAQMIGNELRKELIIDRMFDYLLGEETLLKRLEHAFANQYSDS
jgi:hypothetical protein